MDEMSKRIAVVTGATGGIGRAIVAELDSRGFSCVLLGKHEDELKNVLKGLKTAGAKCFVCDFSKVEEVIGVGKKISSEFGEINVLLNVAGIGVYKAIEEVEIKEWEDSFTIGNTSPYFLTKELLPSLKKNDNSVVINIGSGMGVIPTAGRSVYCSMKFALRGQTLSLAQEFKGSKPDFVLMSLGSVLTSFGPMSLEEKRREMESGKGYLTPEWVATEIMKVIESDEREAEYTFYPSNY